MASVKHDVKISLGTEVNSAATAVMQRFAADLGVLQKLGSKVLGAGGMGMMAAGGLAVGGGAAVMNQLREIIASGRELAAQVQHTSEQTSMSPEFISGLMHVSKVKGVAPESLAGIITRMQTNAAKAKDAFRELGIVSAKSLPPEELFLQAMRGLASVEDGTKRTALANAIAGKGGAMTLKPLIESFTQLHAEGLKLRPVTTEMAANAELATEGWDRLASAVEGVKIQFAALFNELPALNALLDLVGKIGPEAIAKGLYGSAVATATMMGIPGAGFLQNLDTKESIQEAPIDNLMTRGSTKRVMRATADRTVKAQEQGIADARAAMALYGNP